MNLEETYRSIIDGLKNGGRGSVKLSKPEVVFLQKELEGLENAKTPDKIDQILCILSHDQGFHKELTPALINLIKNLNNNDSLIFALSTFSRHGIAAKLREGERINEEILKILESLLLHEDHEVVEWVLRTIDEMGSQGQYFLPLLKKIKPGKVSALLNRHKKNIKEIIEMLEKRWRISGQN